MQPSFGHRILIGTFKGINKIAAWHRLPKWLGVVNLIAFREELRAKNLHDDRGADGQTRFFDARQNEPQYAGSYSRR